MVYYVSKICRMTEVSQENDIKLAKSRKERFANDKCKHKVKREQKK